MVSHRWPPAICAFTRLLPKLSGLRAGMETPVLRFAGPGGAPQQPRNLGKVQTRRPRTARSRHSLQSVGASAPASAVARLACGSCVGLVCARGGSTPPEVRQGYPVPPTPQYGAPPHPRTHTGSLLAEVRPGLCPVAPRGWCFGLRRAPNTPLKPGSAEAQEGQVREETTLVHKL